MQPLDFLDSYTRHQQQLASQPSPEQVFVEGQFKAVLETMSKATAEMLRFLKSYHPTATVDNFPKAISTPDVDKVVKAVQRLETALKPIPDNDSDVLKALKALQKEVKDSKPEAVTVTNLQELADKLERTIRAIEQQNLAVNVAAPDLKPLVKAIKDNKPEPVDLSKLASALASNLKATNTVTDTLKKLRFPVANVPTDPLIKYTPADIDDAGSVQYFGYISADGSWYIRQFDTTGTYKTIRFCFGAAAAPSTYTNNWTNRANLTYTLWSQ